jgi:hypothetical protein
MQTLRQVGGLPIAAGSYNIAIFIYNISGRLYFSSKIIPIFKLIKINYFVF